MAEWINGTVVAVTHFTETLFSLVIEAETAPFIAGQFIKLALTPNDQRIARAYSYVNAPDDPRLEFYIANVAHGKLTPYLHQLHVNDTLSLTRHANGYFILDEIPDTEILWLLATGTGIAPYLSMLQHGRDLERFHKIVLVHAVRYQRDLSYWPLMKQLKDHYLDKVHIQPIVSREPCSGALQGRIPQLILNGKLEASTGLKMHADQSHIMLCGNPDMIAETQTILKEHKHMRKNLRRLHGQFTSELYW